MKTKLKLKLPNASEIRASLDWHQTEAMDKASSFLASALTGKAWKPFALLGGAGMGKSRSRKKMVEVLTDHGFTALTCPARDAESMRIWLVDNLESDKPRVIYQDEIQQNKAGKESPWQVLKEAWEGDGEDVSVTVEIETKTESGTVRVPHTITYRPSKTIWIISGNEESKDDAFVRRCINVTLRPYGPKGMTSILLTHAKERGLAHLLESKACLELVRENCIPNGGASESLWTEIALAYPHYRRQPDEDALTTLENLLVRAGQGPNGWTRYHYLTLVAARTARLEGKRLTLGDYGVKLDRKGKDAAARMITELIGAGYMITSSSGKVITAQGMEFLEQLDEWVRENPNFLPQND